MGAGRGRVVVIGGGIAGLSVAWQLAADHDVIVLEQNGQPGAEATAQNAGMVRRLIHDPYERRLALRAADFYADPGPDWDDLSPSRRTGAVLGLAYDHLHLHDAIADGRVFGVRAESVDPRRLAEVAPALAGAPLVQAWYLPDERIADPHAVLTGLLRGLRRMGGELRCDAGVSELMVRAGRIVGVRTPEGDVGADSVVLAAGAWSGTLAARAGLSRPLLVLRRTLLQSVAQPLSHRDHPWCWIDDAGIYARPEAGGWLCSPCDETRDPPRPGPGSAGPTEPLAIALAGDKLARFMPALAGTRWQGGWTGLRTFAPDRLPMLGEDPELAGLWWTTALGGFGVTCGFAAGEAVATWMRGEDTPWLLREAVAPGRYQMTRVPISPTGDINRMHLVDVGASAPGRAL